MIKGLSISFCRFVLALGFLWAVAQTTSAQDLSVNNTSANIGSGRYKWTIYIETGKELLSRIDYVEYRLPSAYGDRAVQKVSAPRTGKYPFSFTDSTFEPFSIGVTIFFKDNQYRKLPDYTLNLEGSIMSPGGVAVTPLLKLKQYNSIDVPAADFQGALNVYVDDIHNSRRKPFYIKITKVGSPGVIKDGNLYSGSFVSLPFNYGGRTYVLTGFTRTGGFGSDYLYFKIYRTTVK
jgi:YEATS family